MSDVPTTPEPFMCVTLDVETTGLDPVKDRIIELAMRFDWGLGGDDLAESYVVRFNPGMPIPAESTAIHGITDGDVADCLSFDDYASAAYKALSRVKGIIGYNVSFDLAFLAEEFGRCGMVWPIPGTLVLDGYKIWQQQMPRTLENACRAYGFTPDPERLHAADYDVEMTALLIGHQVTSMATMADMVLRTNGILLDPAGKIALDQNGNAIYTFGKNAGQAVLSQRGYANWMIGADFPKCTKNILRGLLQDADYLDKLGIKKAIEASQRLVSQAEGSQA